MKKTGKRYPREWTEGELEQQKEQKRVSGIIEAKCADFGCPGEIAGAKAGPMVTVYKFSPYRYTRIKNLKTLHEDLAVAIPAESVTVMRAPGEMMMNVTVPNQVRKVVSFDDTLQNVVDHRYDMMLPMNLGVTSVGDPMVFDLATGPHLLVAGSTGTGKSVLLNCILTSLLYVRSPKQVELMLIDPKSVELLPYSGLPHVKRPPVSNCYESIAMLNTIIEEMKRRTAFMYSLRVKNLKELNERLVKMGEQTLPYWVLVIDEMSDLVITEKKLFTEAMVQISSMARAAGIHVIAATQRPSVDILSGKIKVNFPARVGLRLPSAADSKTVFGRAGAEQLLGKGDMYFLSPDMPGLQRVHAPFCREEDIRKMLHLSSEMGHHDRVPADGLPQMAPTPPEPTIPAVEEPIKVENTAAVPPGTARFFKEKNLTLEEVKGWPEAKKAKLRQELTEWHRKQRQRRLF